MSFLRLIRFPNLVIVALTQFLLYYQIFLPALHREDIQPALDIVLFILFSLVTVLITAAGYIINDIIDLEIDLLNKPQKVIISRKISHQTAYWLYFCLNITGFILALAIALQVNRMHLLFIFPMAVFGLLAYSAWLKKRPFVGNLLIAVYCAGVAAIVWLAEFPALQKLSSAEYQRLIHLSFYYAGFALLSTLFREIVKDIEDTHGDVIGGARTLPIVWGKQAAKSIAFATGVLLQLLLAYVIINSLEDLNNFAVLSLVGLIILISIGEWLLYRAESKLQFHRLSQFSKIIMLGGILLLLLF